MRYTSEQIHKIINDYDTLCNKVLVYLRKNYDSELDIIDEISWIWLFTEPIFLVRAAKFENYKKIEKRYRFDKSLIIENKNKVYNILKKYKDLCFEIQNRAFIDHTLPLNNYVYKVYYVKTKKHQNLIKYIACKTIDTQITENYYVPEFWLTCLKKDLNKAKNKTNAILKIINKNLDNYYEIREETHNIEDEEEN